MSHILTEMLRERVGSSFDNEATFSADEVEQIITALEKVSPPPFPLLVGDGEAEIIECLAAGKPFVFDPATNFLHADDGTVEGSIRYVPVPDPLPGMLLPCPFCGGEPEFQESTPYDRNDDVAFTVFCRECGTEHPWRGTAEEAVAFWNRRAAISATSEGGE